MTTKKTTAPSKPPAKTAAQKGEKTGVKSDAKTPTKTSTKNKPAARSKTTTSARPHAKAPPVDAVADQEPGHGRTTDPSDDARDQRLRTDLEADSGRSASDRHRERLTAVEAEEDGVLDDDDEDDDEKGQRELALGQVDAEEDRS